MSCMRRRWLLLALKFETSSFAIVEESLVVPV